MKWRRIPKEQTAVPNNGTHKNWKGVLAVEGFHQCVYCSISEATFGGSRNFHVEHFRPKSRFAHLENDFRNLFYACAICNTFKGNDWHEPGGDPTTHCYLDPSAVDYATVFGVNNADYLVTSGSVAGRYMLERLYLNRPQLLLERRLQFARSELERIDQEVRQFRTQVDLANPDELRAYIAVVEWYQDAMKFLIQAIEAVPYAEADIRRA